MVVPRVSPPRLPAHAKAKGKHAVARVQKGFLQISTNKRQINEEGISGRRFKLDRQLLKNKLCGINESNVGLTLRLSHNSTSRKFFVSVLNSDAIRPSPNARPSFGRESPTSRLLSLRRPFVHEGQLHVCSRFVLISTNLLSSYRRR